MKIKPEAQALLDRLCAVDWALPKHDIDAVVRAYRKLPKQGWGARKVRWIKDPVDFNPWISANSRPGFRLWALFQLVYGPCRSLITLSCARAMATSCMHDQDFARVWDPHPGWGAACMNNFDWHRTKPLRPTEQRRIVQYHAWSAGVAIYFLNCNLRPEWEVPQEKIDLVVKACMPMFDAYEAGAFAHINFNQEALVLAAPAIHVDGQCRVHRDDGPALEWPDTKIWAWRGVAVPKYVVTNPEKITAKSIDQEKNSEIRRVMAERYGFDRYLSRMPVIHEDETGKLRNHLDTDGTWVKIVEVVNGTVEPDGTRKKYTLKVPPRCKTAIEGVAWSYGVTAEQYKNLVVRT